MRGTPRMIGLAAGAAVSMLGLLPATPAAADTIIPRPSDCTEISINTRTRALNCTDRPAGQEWYVRVVCTGGWYDTEADGNLVVGSGTSTAVCPGGLALPYVSFVLKD